MRLELGDVLVVDDSLVMREMLRTMLAVHSERVHTAGSFGEARDELRSRGDIDIVLCDVVLPDGDGFTLLEEDRKAGSERRWILMTARPTADGVRLARERDALDYLGKPVAFRDIARALRRSEISQGSTRAAARARFGLATALLDNTGRHGALLELDMVDVSTTGAFLATPGPFALGTRFELEIALADGPLRVSATVVRVQEPGWGRTGGVGVRFEDADQAGIEALRRVAHTRGRRSTQ